MDIYYFESAGQGYVCKSWHQYGKTEIIVNTYHMVGRKPTLEEAEGFYNLLGISNGLAIAPDFEPVLLLPAPTDWASELEKISLLREKALNEIRDAGLPTSVWTTIDEIDGGYNQVCGGFTSGGFPIIAKKKSRYFKGLGELSERQVLQLAASVQKAIAERNPRP